MEIKNWPLYSILILTVSSLMPSILALRAFSTTTAGVDNGLNDLLVEGILVELESITLVLIVVLALGCSDVVVMLDKDKSKLFVLMERDDFTAQPISSMSSQQSLEK